MKVLMYGWEFPPKISGGLGVACYAIVRSLEELGVQVGLVLPDSVQNPNQLNPTLHEGEQLDNLLKLCAAQHAGGAGSFGFTTDSFACCSGLGPYSGVDSRWGAQNSEDLLQRLLTEIVHLSPNSSLKAFLEERVIPLGMLNCLRDSGMVASVLRYAIRAGSFAQSCAHQVIHAHDWLTILAALEGRSFSGKPVVLHIHALEVDRSGVDNRGIIYQIEKFGMEQADQIIAVSEFTKRNIITYYGIAADKITVIHNGVLPASRVSQPLSKKCPMVLFLGRITHQKGPYYFIEIARLVLQVLPETQFVFAGTGDLLKSMIERVAQLRLGSNIHFTGFLNPDQVQCAYGLADVYVMPSVSEPFGLSALEAAQQGVPVIVSKQSGVAEVMPNIFKVDFWDSEKFANQVVSLLKHQPLAKESANNALRDLNKLTWERAVRRMIQVYAKAQQKE